jgi:hypothetical protein
MTNVVIQLTLKQLDERIATAIKTAIKEAVAPLKNRLAKLEYSLMYRDMSACRLIPATKWVYKNVRGL